MQVHAHTFPFEPEIDLESLALELEGIGYLQRYEVNGRKYACIPGFTEHQRITGKEAQNESQHPEPPDVSRVTERRVPEKQEGNAECVPEKHLDAQEQGTGKEEQGVGISPHSGASPPRSRTVPSGWQPNPLMERQAKPAKGVDRDYELRQFRMHEFQQAVSDFDRKWVQWLNRASPRKKPPDDVRSATVSFEDSKHPSVVAERESRQRSGLQRFGDMS